MYQKDITMASKPGFAPHSSGGDIAIPMNVILPSPRDDHYVQEIPLEAPTATPHPRVVLQNTVSTPWFWLKEKTTPIWRRLQRIPKVHLMVNVAIIIILVAACTGLGVFGGVPPPILVWLASLIYGILTFVQFLVAMVTRKAR